MVTIVFFSILVADVLWWWRADRHARRWRHPVAWRIAIGLFMGGQLALVLWSLSGRAMPFLGRPPEILLAAAYLWHLLLLPAGFAFLAITRLLYGAWLLGRRPAVSTDAEQNSLPQTSRRQFLDMVTTVTPALLTGAAVGYSRIQLREFRIRPMDVALPGLPPELNGLRIALVADLHVGPFTNGPTVKRIVEATSRLDADLILLPGDLINNALADLSDALDAVCNMQSRHGAYLCVGNHDLIESGAEFVRRAKARVPLLVNEARIIPIRGQHVQLLGLPWNRDEELIADSVQELARQITPNAFPILLAHHPHAFDAAARAGIPLTVAGHTHGGQLMLGDSVGFGPLLYRYWSGLYQMPQRNGASLIVSNGVGNWFPIRTFAPAEIIDLTLRAVTRNDAK